VKFIVGDISRDVQSQLRNGTIAAAVFQDPYQQGRTGVEYAVMAATDREKEVPSPLAYQEMKLFTSADWSKVPDNALF
jgi:ABC-type sugar transport system substrate-binding protein